MNVDAVERFSSLVAGSEPNLDEGALAIAAGAEPNLDTGYWLGELDRMADNVDSLDGLVRRLFVDEGFTGNRRRYYDHSNSLLHRVLSRRLGIPITLAVVCIEVGRRAGIELEGVGMPGHFLVRVPGTDHYLDAFDGGTALGPDGCEALFREATGSGDDVAFGPELLPTASVTTILTRMLENLRGVYRTTSRPTDLEWVLRMRLALPEAGGQEVLELGQAIGAQGRFLDGARYLEDQAQQRPSQSEALGHAARQLRARLN